MGKVSFVVGLGVGYVLGARAGRGQYERIKKQASSVWENPTVASARESAAEKVGDVARQAPGAVGSAVKTAAEKVGDRIEDARDHPDSGSGSGAGRTADPGTSHDVSVSHADSLTRGGQGSADDDRQARRAPEPPPDVPVGGKPPEPSTDRPVGGKPHHG